MCRWGFCSVHAVAIYVQLAICIATHWHFHSLQCIDVMHVTLCVRDCSRSLMNYSCRSLAQAHVSHCEQRSIHIMGT